MSTQFEKAHRLVHKLWTKAVGTEDYNKSEWLELEALVYGLFPKEERTLQVGVRTRLERAADGY
jgi:hypothetical protein